MHDLQRRHVDIVDVRTLLTIDFDVDEVLVHVLGNLFILEHLAFHDVAPIATAVTDREKNHFAFLLGLLERLRPPGIPVNRVVTVHQQIRTGFARQSIGELGVRLRVGFLCFLFAVVRIGRRDKMTRLPMQAINKGEETISVNGKKVDVIKVYYSITGKFREKHFNHDYYYRKSDGVFMKKVT